MTNYYPLFILMAAFLSCQPPDKGNEDDVSLDPEQGTFAYDLQFLRGKDSVVVLSNNEGTGQLIVSPKYQGKVFTSTAEGPEGRSFGWVNYSAFEGPEDPHMNAYGGENRFWLGPEGNKFSLFFDPGDEMTFESWKTPAPIDTEPWELISSGDKKVVLKKGMKLQNYAGTQFDLEADREVEVIETADVERMLGIVLPREVSAVAFKTINTITNTGPQEWTREGGAPCIWILDMLTPSPSTTVVIPYKENQSGKVATTDYFGEIPAERIHIEAGVVAFKADGQARGKLGLSPERAKPIAGSYDVLNNVLTLTMFDVDSTAVYLNQEWTTTKDPFSGDAVNAYNDGPLENGEQMGPFYEIESVSPAGFLKPGERLQHNHHVFHFTGSESRLNEIAVAVLGISIQDIKAFLP